MAKNTDNRAIVPLFIFFIMVNSFCLLFKDWLNTKGIDPVVLGIGNCILFFLSVIIFFMQKKSLQNTNPNAFVRAIMGGTLLKLVVIAGAVVIYLVSAGEKKSIYAVIACMGLYFVYTFIEVKTVSRINKEHGRH